MKLIIQIPCLNEEKTLPVTVSSLPRSLSGVEEVEILVVDDGSSDRTAEVARRLGVDHVLVLPTHQGLARAFMVGLEACLKQGADIIVNTDADNQYDARDLERLIAPILEGRADLVIGDRRVQSLGHFSHVKRFLHRVGDRVMRQLSGLDLLDSTSGYRAFNREAALKLNVFSRFTYTLETLIQAGKKRLAVAHVPVGVNAQLRESRLFPNLWFYIKRSVSTMVRIYAMYEPLKVFSYVGGSMLLVGSIFIARFLYFFFTIEGPAGHLQSLVVGTTLVALGVFTVLIGVVSDLMAASRQLLEDVQYRLRKMEIEGLDERRKLERGSEKRVSTPWGAGGGNP